MNLPADELSSWQGIKCPSAGKILSGMCGKLVIGRTLLF